jgi:molybdopterin synthase catalytic subunit
MKAKIQAKEFDLSSLINKLRYPGAGALIFFLGTVREFGGKAIEVKTDKNKARQLAELADKAIKEFKLLDALVVHREGKLKIQEPIAFIGVASEHRKEGFEGCEWLIDQVKKLIPIKEAK